MHANQVLVADYDPHSRAVLRRALETAGYEVTEADARQFALDLARSGQFQIVLLDSSMDAFRRGENCCAARSSAQMAIIVLSNISGERDAIEALTWADDYVIKPFHMPELLARIRAVERRLTRSKDRGLHRVELHDRVVDFQAHLIRTGDNRMVHLTPKECQLLRYLIAHPDQALTHQSLLQAVWGSERRDDVGYVRVFIKQLRKKIEPNPKQPRFILTEPWVGYRFRPAKVDARSNV